MVRPMATSAGNFKLPSGDVILVRSPLYIRSTIDDQAPLGRTGIVRVE